MFFKLKNKWSSEKLNVLCKINSRNIPPAPTYSVDWYDLYEQVVKYYVYTNQFYSSFTVDVEID